MLLFPHTCTHTLYLIEFPLKKMIILEMVKLIWAYYAAKENHIFKDFNGQEKDHPVTTKLEGRGWWERRRTGQRKRYKSKQREKN